MVVKCHIYTFSRSHAQSGLAQKSPDVNHVLKIYYIQVKKHTIRDIQHTHLQIYLEKK